MNNSIAISMINYFETLYEMNQKLIVLCGDIFYFNSRKKLLELIQDIPRVIPYSFNKRTGKLEFKERDGFLEFKDEIEYLEVDFKTILDNNYDFLDKIRHIRNKYEHKMHAAKPLTYGTGPNIEFEYEFLVESDEEFALEVTSKEFIKLLKELNVLYSKIQKEIGRCNYKIGNQETDNLYYQYYKKMCRFDFERFNDIFDSKLLQIFGQSMLEF